MRNIPATIERIKEYQLLILALSILISSLIISLSIFFHKSYPKYTPIAGAIFYDADSGYMRSIVDERIAFKVKDVQEK